MDVHQLRVFLAVIDAGSFSKAARTLGMNQSTVSFHIRALESACGVRLLDRAGRAVKPTTSGRVLRRYAARMVDLRDEALAQLRAEEAGDSGRVRIAASTVPAEYLLPRLIARFRAQHPGVELASDGSIRGGAPVG